jgi:hypothetical protein
VTPADALHKATALSPPNRPSLNLFAQRENIELVARSLFHQPIADRSTKFSATPRQHSHRFELFRRWTQRPEDCVLSIGGDKMTGWITHFATSILVYPILSLFEYALHRHLMHRPMLVKSLGGKYLWNTFWEHATIHHRRCYELFDHSEGECAFVNIQIKLSTTCIAAAMPFMIIIFFDYLTLFVFWWADLSMACYGANFISKCTARLMRGFAD